MNTFTFNGVSSSTHNIKIATTPSDLGAAPTFESLEIPGRTGSLIIPTGAYQNSLRSYTISILKTSNLVDQIRAIRKWLYVPGYHRLTDTYEPNTYRLARYLENSEFGIWMGQAAQTTINFDCDPRKFLTAGETPIVCTSQKTITNNYYKSNPLIVIKGAAAHAKIYIGSYLVEIGATAPPLDLYIDSEKQVIYHGSTNYSQYVNVMTDFPHLEPGSNIIKWTGTVSEVDVTPNWFML